MFILSSLSKKIFLNIILSLFIGFSLLSLVSCQSAHANDSQASYYNDWSWFKDTYWIVPEQGIYSIAHNPNNPSQFHVLRGQTVFHLTDYFNGYFTGAVVVKLTESLVPSCQYVLGEVTPQGAVYLTMYNATDGSLTNTPIGNMVQVNGEWTMVNTMTGPTNTGGTVSHWAYMVLSKPGQPTWNDLPFAHESIPEFMAACPPGPMIGI